MDTYKIALSIIYYFHFNCLVRVGEEGDFLGSDISPLWRHGSGPSTNLLNRVRTYWIALHICHERRKTCGIEEQWVTLSREDRSTRPLASMRHSTANTNDKWTVSGVPSLWDLETTATDEFMESSVVLPHYDAWTINPFYILLYFILIEKNSFLLLLSWTIQKEYLII